MSKVDLDEIEASLGYLKDWKKVIKELRAAREVIDSVKCAYAGKTFSVDKALGAIKRYDEVVSGPSS